MLLNRTPPPSSLDQNRDGVPDECAEDFARFLRGDCNGDGRVDVSDASCALNWLFVADSVPACVAAVNTNGDDTVNIADPVSLLNFLFGGGPMITEPFPECGPGKWPADTALGCSNPPDCE